MYITDILKLSNFMEKNGFHMYIYFLKIIVLSPLATDDWEDLRPLFIVNGKQSIQTIWRQIIFASLYIFFFHEEIIAPG